MYNFTCTECKYNNISDTKICEKCFAYNKDAKEPKTKSLNKSTIEISISSSEEISKTKSILPATLEESKRLLIFEEAPSPIRKKSSDANINTKKEKHFETPVKISSNYSRIVEMKKTTSKNLKPNNILISSTNSTLLTPLIPHLEELEISFILIEEDTIQNADIFIIETEKIPKKTYILTDIINNYFLIEELFTLDSFEESLCFLVEKEFKLYEKLFTDIMTLFVKSSGKIRFFQIDKNESPFDVLKRMFKKVSSTNTSRRDEGSKLDVVKALKRQISRKNIEKPEGLEKEELEVFKAKNSFYKMISSVDGIDPLKAKRFVEEFPTFSSLNNFRESLEDKDTMIKRMSEIKVGNTSYSKKIGPAAAENIYEYFFFSY